MPAPDPFDVFTIPELDRLQQTYNARNDQAGAARVQRALDRKISDGVPQTEEVANSGKLYARRFQDDDTGRTKTAYTGDISAFMAPFILGATVGKINRELFSGENSPTARAHAAEQRALIAEGLAARAARSK